MLAVGFMSDFHMGKVRSITTKTRPLNDTVTGMQDGRSSRVVQGAMRADFVFRDDNARSYRLYLQFNDITFLELMLEFDKACVGQACPMSCSQSTTSYMCTGALQSISC
ncbi:hypothetical protein TNCV_4935641 [Trichonephila clavipes]|nr:hypothetical protein TNCV_4935641 [Trichonephila clavipes]